MAAPGLTKSMAEMTVTKASKTRQKTSALTAFVTVGRWQPPHMGHFLLIDELYQKAMDDGMAEAFVYVTDKIKVKPDSGWVSENWEEYNRKNPLTGIQKLYYLSLMFPAETYPKLKFLVGFDINPVPVLLKNFTRNYPYPVKKSTTLKELQSLYELRSNALLSPIGIDLFQKIKNLQDIRKPNKPFGNRVVRLAKKYFDRSPSTACINFFDKRKYKTMKLLVGSDRVDAFTQYNSEHMSNAFEDGGEVGQLGGERGVAGSGKLFKIDVPSEADDNEDAKGKRKSIGKALDFCVGEGGEGDGCSISIKDGQFSGTNIRNTCYLFTTVTTPIDIISLLRGINYNDNMSSLDCICLINDVRLGAKYQLPHITVEDWNTQIENTHLDLTIQLPFHQKKCVNCPLLQLMTNNSAVQQLLKEKLEYTTSPVKNKPVYRLVPSQVITRTPNRPISGEEDGNMGQNPDYNTTKISLQGGGTRKRKKKKRRRRKTKRNRKRRKNKHSRKRKRKRRRKRKTRRN